MRFKFCVLYSCLLRRCGYSDVYVTS